MKRLYDPNHPSVVAAHADALHFEKMHQREAEKRGQAIQSALAVQQTINAPRTFNRNDQRLTREGQRLESHAQLARMATEAESLTPNDALRLAQRLLVGVNNYGFQQRPDFQSPQAVERYVRKAINALKGLSLS